MYHVTCFELFTKLESHSKLESTIKNNTTLPGVMPSQWDLRYKIIIGRNNAIYIQNVSFWKVQKIISTISNKKHKLRYVRLLYYCKAQLLHHRMNLLENFTELSNSVPSPLRGSSFAASVHRGFFKNIYQKYKFKNSAMSLIDFALSRHSCSRC